jgi:hypothetical protein
MSSSDKSRRSSATAWLGTALWLSLAACTSVRDTTMPPSHASTRTQLSIGYSLLYQEADGIPKLRWIVLFKDKSEEMARVTHDLVGYYQQLAETMRRLSTQYPAMRIDVSTMPEIEAATRKAIGVELAKDIAPLTGKEGMAFEREALLALHSALDEQRHLTAIMLERETSPALRSFLETTHTQLDERYATVGALLERRYFTH